MDKWTVVFRFRNKIGLQWLVCLHPGAIYRTYITIIFKDLLYCSMANQSQIVYEASMMKGDSNLLLGCIVRKSVARIIDHLDPSRKLDHAIYRDFFHLKKIENFIRKILIFFFFAQNIDCGYTLEPPRRNTRKIGIPLHTPVLLYKSGVYGGIHCMDMFS